MASPRNFLRYNKDKDVSYLCPFLFGLPGSWAFNNSMYFLQLSVSAVGFLFLVQVYCIYCKAYAFVNHLKSSVGKSRFIQIVQRPKQCINVFMYVTVT